MLILSLIWKLIHNFKANMFILKAKKRTFWLQGAFNHAIVCLGVTNKAWYALQMMFLWDMTDSRLRRAEEWITNRQFWVSSYRSSRSHDTRRPLTRPNTLSLCAWVTWPRLNSTQNISMQRQWVNRKGQTRWTGSDVASLVPTSQLNGPVICD